MDDQVIVWDRSQLTNRSYRYYLTDDIEPGDIYISNIDLNIENNEVTIPYQPVIRFVKGIYKKDDFLGYIVLNYKAVEVANRYGYNDNNAGIGKFLVNDQGYWLIGPNDATSWGFMFESEKNSKVEDSRPGLWENIKASNDLSSYYGNKGVYTYDVINLKGFEFSGNEILSSETVYIISFTSYFTLLADSIIWFLILTALVLVITVSKVYNNWKRQLIASEANKKTSKIK